MLFKLAAEGCFSAIAASFNPAFNTDASPKSVAPRQLTLRYVYMSKNNAHQILGFN